MAATLKKRDTFRWTVEHLVQIVSGVPEFMKFDAVFRAVPQTRVVEIMGLAKKGELKDDAFLAEVLVGWADLDDEAGKPLEFTPENLAQLREAYPGIVGSITRAFTESVMGGAARKN